MPPAPRYGGPCSSHCTTTTVASRTATRLRHNVSSHQRCEVLFMRRLVCQQIGGRVHLTLLSGEHLCRAKLCRVKLYPPTADKRTSGCFTSTVFDSRHGRVEGLQRLRPREGVRERYLESVRESYLEEVRGLVRFVRGKHTFAPCQGARWALATRDVARRRRHCQLCMSG